MATLKQAHGGDGGEVPGQFVHLGHRALAENDCLLRVHPAGQKIEKGLLHQRVQLARYGRTRQGMIVGQKVVGLPLSLQFDGRSDHPEIVP